MTTIKLLTTGETLNLKNRNREWRDGLNAFVAEPTDVFSFKTLAKAHPVLVEKVLASELKDRFMIEFWNADFTAGHDGEPLHASEARFILTTYVEALLA